MTFSDDIIENELENESIAFPKLNDEDIQALSKFVKVESFQKGQKLFTACERNFKFFIIKTGQVEITDSFRGRDKPIAVLGPSQFTGDIDMIIGRPAFVSAFAKTKCVTYDLTADDLKHIINEMPRLSAIFLKAFLARKQLLEKSGVTGVKIIGSRFSKDTNRIRSFLSNNKVIFTWVDLENDPRVNTLLLQFKVTPDDTPIVICADDTLLRNPSNIELAENLGIRKPAEHIIYDLVIIGAGPAGLAAAVYGASEGLKTLVLDKISPGGQAAKSSLIENYMGFPVGLSGSDLANRAVIQAQKFGATISAATEAMHLSSEHGAHVIKLDNGENIIAKCILIATGVWYRRLNVPGSEKFDGTGIYYSATSVEAQLCHETTVIIVGDGNSAGQAAIFLGEYAKKVYILTLEDKLGVHMSHYLAARIEKTNNIEVRPLSQINKMYGDKTLSAVDLTNLQSGESENIACNGVFVFIGATPYTAWLDTIEIDSSGFIKTGKQIQQWSLDREPFLLETNRPGIFAAGDVRLGSIKRVASAVGEGAMAVQFVHQYLSTL